MWRRRPGLMLLGMLPALLVFTVLATAIVLFALNSTQVAETLTPFADGWADGPQTVLRGLLAIVMVVALLVLALASFTGLTLLVGDPFYERIWKATEKMQGVAEIGDGQGFWASVGDTVRLMAVGLLAAVLVFVLGLLPIIGTIAALVLGITFSGRLLAAELLGRPLGARGMDRTARAQLLRTHRGPVFGFGVATQAFFLIPLGAVVVIPAAVVGSTLLAHELLALDRLEPPRGSIEG